MRYRPIENKIINVRQEKKLSKNKIINVRQEKKLSKKNLSKNKITKKRKRGRGGLFI